MKAAVDIQGRSLHNHTPSLCTTSQQPCIHTTYTDRTGLSIDVERLDPLGDSAKLKEVFFGTPTNNDTATAAVVTPWCVSVLLYSCV